MKCLCRRSLLILIILLFPEAVLFCKPYSFYGIIEQKNIFKPLWEANKVKPVDTEEIERKRQEEQQRMEEERRKIEEKRLLESKKVEIAQNLILSGVVFDGTNVSALITDQRTGIGGSYKVNDEIGGAKITKIDENSQVVYLDYEGKFQVVLKIKTAR